MFIESIREILLKTFYAGATDNNITNWILSV